MKKIKLTQGQYTIVDNRDYEKLILHKWYARYDPSTRSFYAVRSGKPKQDGTRSPILMHRVIAKAPKGKEVDHVNCKTLDNRRINLRICTRAENQRNRSFQRNNTSGYKGVTWCKSKRRFSAVIIFNKKRYPLGDYKTAFQAAIAYRVASKLLFKKFSFRELK